MNASKLRAKTGDFALFARRDQPSTDWLNLKVIRTGEAPKIWWLSWNGKRLSRRKDTGKLAEHNPKILQWVIDTLVALGEWRAADKKNCPPVGTIFPDADPGRRIADIPPRADRSGLIYYAATSLDDPPLYHDTEPVRRLGEKLHRIRWQGRQWAVTSYGIEARDGTYPIAKDRLWHNEDTRQGGWICHMAEKNWVDIFDFAEALRIGRHIHASQRSFV
jgi:hypothetical protein